MNQQSAVHSTLRHGREGRAVRRPDRRGLGVLSLPSLLDDHFLAEDPP